MKLRGVFLCVLPMLLALALPVAPASGLPATVPAPSFSVAAPLYDSPAPLRVAEACDIENESSASVVPLQSLEGDLMGVRAAQSRRSGAPAAFCSPASALTGRRNE
jgi:hypothetical protein